MTGEINSSSADSLDDDEYEMGRISGFSPRFTAPTTHKRMGRCTKRPPGPSVDDGPSESASSTAETPEDLGTAIIESIQSIAKTRKGHDDLGQALDGHTEESRAPQDAEKLRRLILQLRQEHTFDVPVFAIARGRDVRLQHLNGDVPSVRLVQGQHAMWVGHGAKKAIIVAADLSPIARVDATLRILADEVEAIAVENGIDAHARHLLIWFRKLAQRFV